MYRLSLPFFLVAPLLLALIMWARRARLGKMARQARKDRKAFLAQRGQQDLPD